VVYRKLPSYIYKRRQGYGLQRAVPSDLRVVLGKAKFKEPGGDTLNEARARVPGFVARTDELIRTARGHSRLTNDQLMEALPELTADWGMDPQDVVVALQMLGLKGVDALTPEQVERGSQLVLGKAQPRRLYTAEDLLDARRRDRQPAARTYEGWKKALTAFMEFTKKASPLSCTEQDAADYKDHLLGQVSRNTAKVQLAYLSGLWTTLLEKNKKEKPVHIFKGLASSIEENTKEKALRAAQRKQNRTFEPSPIEMWSGSVYVPVFKILYYTGCRLAEVAALRGEDIHNEHISVEWHEERSLKTANSVRDIPIHPKLADVLRIFRGAEGYLWPRLKTVKEVDGVEVIRWGHNLSKPCKQITGLKPKDFRDRFVTRLRSLDFNQINIERLTGHSALTTNSTYGGMDWPKYVQMIHSLQ
jgi:integrase